MHQLTIDDLRKVIAFSELPDAHLQWILDRSEYKEFEDGVQMVKKGDPVELMWIILDGILSFYMDVNGLQVHYFDFANDTATGGVSGLMPYSRMKNSPGYSYAKGKLRRLSLHKKYFPELEQLNPDLIQRLIGYMTERAKSFATTQLQHEKVKALGNLSAGIAHELNNPASAIDRISYELEKRLKRNYILTEKLLHHQIKAEHIFSIRSLVEAKETEQSSKKRLTAFQRMEKEDEITNWLEQNGMLGNHLVGETFAEASFTGNDLEKIRGDVGKEAFIQVLHWLENLLSSQRIMRDLEEASRRISHLVGAIKSHVHMDRTHEMQPTNIITDIENTLTLLGYKLREKNISVKRNFSDNLPMVLVYVGELNQVWTNIIDNAIYAMNQNGELEIKICYDTNFLEVRFTDNGSGIPPEIVSRIFDPFFTTKKVGEGTGIGLDLVNRIIKHHDGKVKVNSVPGKTEFIIYLPIKKA